MARMTQDMTAKQKRMAVELENDGFGVIPPNYKQCQHCGKIKTVKDNFYLSFSELNKTDGLMHICKGCIEELFVKFLSSSQGDEKYATYQICRLLDAVYNSGAFEGASNSASKTIRVYFRSINTLQQLTGLTFLDSDPYEKTYEEIREEKDIESGKLRLNRDEKKAKDEIIASIGRDPYADFSLRDQKALYPELNEYLDEEVRENPFLVGQIIQITINNNTIKKLNEAMSNITKDISQSKENDGNIKNIITNIQKLSSATTQIAEKNGISKKNSDSKKNSTLTGMMMKYRDYNLEDVEVDYYNQVTSIGMQRVNDLSVKSIFEQGLFTDNDYAEILKHSRDLVSKLNYEVMQLEEENRKLKVRLFENKLDFSDIGVVKRLDVSEYEDVENVEDIDELTEEVGD